MNNEKKISIGLLAIGLIFILARTFLTDHGMGRAYVKVETVKPSKNIIDDSGFNISEPYKDKNGNEIQWQKYDKATQADYYRAEIENPNQEKIQFSLSNTLGIWVAALFTLFILSFLYKDNPLYKVAESVVVGVSAGYWMVVGFWTTIIPNLVGKLHPNLMKNWALPGLEQEPDFVYLIPLIMGLMLIWRLAPKGAWISRWPLAFIVGTTAGMRLISFIHADFLSQIRNSIVPLFVISPNTGFDFWDSLKNIIIVIGVLCTIIYFFFSFEHKGFVGKTARVGIWFLMITFGAAFGYTVMGRIALLAIRIEFLLNDWLWLIDPSNTRYIM